ncbi:hypothetical protein P7C73_g268, partial [Tremellales sp. Uapishka_1]
MESVTTNRELAEKGSYAAKRPEDPDGWSNESLPRYEDLTKADVGKARSSAPLTPPDFSLASRILWPIALLLPVLGAGVLLYLITCSSESWRADLSVVKVLLPSSEYAALYSAGLPQSQDQSSNSSITSSSSVGVSANSAGGTASTRIATVASSSPMALASGVSRMTIRDDSTPRGAGYLTLGFWGWCLESVDSSGMICSQPMAVFDLDQLFDAASLPSSSLSNEDFDEFLVRALVVHGLAMIAIMLSAVPLILLIWRRYWLNNKHAEGGWFQNLTLLTAALTCLGAWIVDKILKLSSVTDKTSYKVSSGLGPSLVGVAAILMLLAFLLSSVPVLVRYMSRQRSYVRHWSDVEKTGEELAQYRTDEAQREAEREAARIKLERKRRRQEGRRRKGRKREAIKRRVTTWWRGDGEEDDEDEEMIEKGVEHDRRSRRGRNKRSQSRA